MRPISILTGNGGLFLDFEMERGADGAMTGYAFPDMLVDVVRLSAAGRRDEAHDLFDAHLPYLRYEQQPGVGLAVRKVRDDENATHRLRRATRAAQWPLRQSPPRGGPADQAPSRTRSQGNLMCQDRSNFACSECFLRFEWSCGGTSLGWATNARSRLGPLSPSKWRPPFRSCFDAVSRQSLANLEYAKTGGASFGRGTPGGSRRLVVRREGEEGAAWLRVWPGLDTPRAPSRRESKRRVGDESPVAGPASPGIIQTRLR